MIGLSRNTLMGQLAGRPLGMLRDISLTNVHDFMDGLKTVSGPAPSPEKIALKFYLLEHAVAAVRQRLNPGQALTAQERALLEEYNGFAMQAAARAIHYVFLICCRESRHIKDNVTDFCAQTLPLPLRLPEGAKLLKGFPDHADANSVYQVMRTHCPKDRTLGQITRFLVGAFFCGKYSSSFGGPKWGGVASCLNEYVQGRITAAMFLDTVWTLEHNTSNIFNKGMLFECVGGAMTSILDAQRIGAIPNMIVTNGAGGDNHGYYYTASHIDKALRETCERLAWVAPEFSKTAEKVDWAKAKAASPTQDLVPEKPEWLSEMLQIAASTGPVTIAPGVTVQKKAR